MKILLATINSKYIQTNLAIRYLKVYLEKHGQADVGLLEFTIKQPLLEMLSDIQTKNPEFLFLSVYIWNVELTFKLVREIKKLLPQTKIVLGGPEVSYRANELNAAYPEIDYIIQGEGEAAALALVTGSVPDGKLLDLDSIPFPYDESIKDSDKLLYYESSRGCPFNCAYCLSSAEQGVRYLSLERVKQDLSFFLQQRVKIVKFVDRTFNVDHVRTKEIWQYLLDNNNGYTKFHFELAGELLTPELLAFLQQVPAGLFQFEIGVQSCNPETLKLIDRPMALAKLAENIRKIPRTIPVHLDLIAGLPQEDFASFQRSFNFVIELKPNNLQLGFLKVLTGTEMEKIARQDEYKYLSVPPYEVLETPWLKYAELEELRHIEHVLDIYYNSGHFKTTLGLVNLDFQFFRDLAQEKSFFAEPRKLEKYYYYLLDFLKLRYPDKIWQEPLQNDYIGVNKFNVLKF